MINDFTVERIESIDVSGLHSTRMPTIDDVPDVIKNNSIPYFITGSVIFGCATNNSDLDICIPIMNQIDIKNAEDSNYNNGIKFMENGIVINLIRLHPVEYVVWHNAVTMANSIKLFNNMDKRKRYSIYEMLRGIAKLSLNETIINSHNYLEYLK